MDMNKSKEKDNFYMDDLLDQMEKGELKTDLFLEEPIHRQSFNDRIYNTSKRFLNLSTKFYRQKSNTSLDMSITSETSNESDMSPFIEDGDQFNWELSSHDYESKIDDSNLDEFYGEYREFLLDNVPRISNRKSASNKYSHLNNDKDNREKLKINKINKTKRGKYHSFKQISNSL